MRRDIRRHRQQGFTLMELIIAGAIAGLVVLFVHQIFNEVTASVRRGTQTGEIIQRARGFNEQLSNETELNVVTFDNPADWNGRMLGPFGKNANPSGVVSMDPDEPGGVLAIVQHVIPSYVTREDAELNRPRMVRSDQLMFIVDQNSGLGEQRLVPLAPAYPDTYAGEMENSYQADHVRIWYGHARMMYPDGTAGEPLGDPTVGSPNRLAKDWVLGRQALFLTATTTAGSPPSPTVNTPAGFAANGVTWNASIGSRNLYEGLSDIANVTLQDMMVTGVGGGLLGSATTWSQYHSAVLDMMFVNERLYTAAKPDLATDLDTEHIAPSHTYLMGGVSDFIVEWAGDLHTAGTNGWVSPGQTYNPDGLLDRDAHGIVWYSVFPNNPGMADYEPHEPTTYGPPRPVMYRAYNDAPGRPHASAAFIWQHAGATPQAPSTTIDGNPAQGDWPWLIRIRYRLHDRRGEFIGRRYNDRTGNEVAEPGRWFETILRVNRGPT